MYKRRVNQMCQGMLGLALAIRVFFGGWGSILPSGAELLTGLLFLETGQVGQFEEREAFVFAPVDLEKLEIVPDKSAETLPTSPQATPAVVEKKIYTQAEADGIELTGTGAFSGEILPLLNETLDLDFSGKSPTVLILHTHTSESYAQAVGWEYDETDTARTQDSQFNIVRVGDVVTEVLEEGGISVIHDETIHDFPNYNQSYGNALETIEFWLEKYPSISMVMDIHRDGAVDGQGLPMAYTTEIDGEDVAQMMLVVGTNQGGLYHPNWEKNLAFALQLEATFQERWPNYARPVNLRAERFNQQATPASILVEIGSHGNTLEEALASGEIFGQGILDLLLQYQGN